MKSQRFILILLMGGWVRAASGAETTTIQASTMLSPGSYMATVAPSFNGGMAKELRDGLDKIPGVESTSASTIDSSVHFKVEKGRDIVKVEDIQKTVGAIFPGAVVSTPVLEHSLIANPGL